MLLESQLTYGWEFVMLRLSLATAYLALVLLTKRGNHDVADILTLVLAGAEYRPSKFPDGRGRNAQRSLEPLPGPKKNSGSVRGVTALLDKPSINISDLTFTTSTSSLTTQLTFFHL